MIERYTREVMKNLWSDETKFNIWLEVEIAVCEALNKLGVIPDDVLQKIKEKAKVDPQKISEIEKETKHDVAAFVRQVSEPLGEEGRFIHYGLTSSDILDTAFAIQLRRAAEIIENDLLELMKVLKEKALQYKNTIAVGRTHGVHAEPITFGLKFASWYEEAKRNLERIRRAKEVISYGKISGAVGTYSNIDPEVERMVMERLNLKPEPVATQVVPRDRHAEYFSVLALIAGFIERVALEIRHLQRTEVLEAEEYFSEGQMGSSAMPHKRNPVLSENLCGLARVVRANLLAALENMALWHERDISHSSVERIIAPDTTTLIDFMLARLKEILQNLIVYPERMKQNLMLTKGLIFSQSILSELIRRGLTRREAYKIVQRNSMRCWETGRSFMELLMEDQELLKHLSSEEIKDLFSEEKLLKNVSLIFERSVEEN